jgi:hypothetical protein
VRILRAARTEIAGAWRSVRYDLGRRSTVPEPADERPDVTSAGLSTFGPVTGLLDRAEKPERPPRRLLTASAFGLLALAGAVGSYVAMGHGLGGLVANRPAAEQPPPVTEPDAAAPSAVRPGRSGRMDRRRDGSVRTAADRRSADRSAQMTPGPGARMTGQQRPAAPSPTCDCLTPPVPTPASQPAHTPRPSRPPRPPRTPTPTPSSPSPEPTGTVSPSLDPPAS